MAIIVKAFWVFGDGETSTEFSPIHTYVMPGEYDWTFETWDEYGNYGSSSGTIYVYDNDYDAAVDAFGAGTSEEVDSIYEDAYYSDIYETRLGDRTPRYNITKTDYCVRFATPQEARQGQGWSEYWGDDWPQPIGIEGSCEVLDDSDQERTIVMDGTSFIAYELGYPDTWKDGVGDYQGSEFIAEILFPEQAPPVEASAKLKHNQYHLFTKPWYKTRRNRVGYNEYGYRPEFAVTPFIKSDSSPADSAVATNIPRLGQVVFDRHIVSEFLQPGVRIVGAPWRLPKAQIWYEQIDTAGAPPQKLMSEMSWALEWTEPILWVTRSSTPGLDFASGVQLAGSSLATTTGRDGFANSALVFGTGNGYTITALLDGLFTISAWVRSPANGSTIVGPLIVQEWEGGWRLQVDGAYHFPLESSLNDWTMITVVFTPLNVLVYESGQQIGAAVLTSPYVSPSSYQMGVGIISLQDVRAVSRAVSAGAIEYLYNDMVQNHANATCPVF